MSDDTVDAHTNDRPTKKATSTDDDAERSRAALAKDIADALHDDEVTVFGPSSPEDTVARPTPRIHSTPDPHAEPVAQPAHDPDGAPLFQLPAAFQDGHVRKPTETAGPTRPPAPPTQAPPAQALPRPVEPSDEAEADEVTVDDLASAFADAPDAQAQLDDTATPNTAATTEDRGDSLLAARDRQVHQLRFDRGTVDPKGVTRPKETARPNTAGSEAETTSEPLPDDGIDQDAVIDLMNHLLWHKALIDERDSGERIETYLDMVRRSHEGEYLAISDPFNRSIALSFQLVLSEAMDPWRIDLGRFSQLYVQRAREHDISLVVAGRVILMAWTVLRMQSEAMVEMAETLAARWDEPEEQLLDWDDIGDWDYDNEDYEYTQRVKHMDGAPLDEKIRRKGAQRKVTLMELVDAFEDARREVEEREYLRTERDRVKTLLKGQQDASVSGMMHKEDPEAELRTVWDRLCTTPIGHDVRLRDIHDPDDLDDLIITFTNILFLAADRKVSLRQEDFPYGPVYVQRLVDLDDPSAQLPDRRAMDPEQTPTDASGTTPAAGPEATEEVLEQVTA